MDLTGKVILVTGAGRGIGRGIALRLAQDGADLVVNDLDQRNLERVASEVGRKNRNCLAVVADVSQKSDVERLFSQAAKELGRIDVSIHNAGIISVAPLVELDERDWDRILSVNAKGVFLCCQAAARQMLKQGYGKIINCSSTAGKQGAAYQTHYAASKFAVIGITQSLAKELGPRGVTVNAFCPGYTMTDMWDYLDPELGKFEGLKPGKKIKKITKAIPLGRFGEPSEIAGLVSFLASDDANYINGQAINVDGGVILS